MKSNTRNSLAKLTARQLKAYRAQLIRQRNDRMATVRLIDSVIGRIRVAVEKCQTLTARIAA